MASHRRSSTRICGFIVSFTMGLSCAHAQTLRAPDKISPETEARIVEMFSRDKCDRIRGLVAPHLIESLRANILAIVASCSPPGKDPERLFRLAEKKLPTGDLVKMLHARYVWKTDEPRARRLFQEVIMLARTPGLADIAKDYLNGVIDKDEKVPLTLRKVTYYGALELGGGYSTNPRDPNFINAFVPSSATSKLRFQFDGQKWYPWGSLSGNYKLSHDDYFSAQQVTMLKNGLDVPIAMHVGIAEDLVFKPFVRYSTQRNAPYQLLYGFGMSGVVYRPTYKQSVQASISKEKLYPGAIAALQGGHYRFDYSWEFFPLYWYMRAQAVIEHVSTDTDVVDSGSATIPYSHTDVGAQFELSRSFELFSLGFSPQFLFRNDTDTTNYTTLAGNPASKRRQDIQVVLLTSITVPILQNLQLYGWYEWSRIYSNFRSQDYADRRVFNDTLGIALKVNWSNY